MNDAEKQPSKSSIPDTKTAELSDNEWTNEATIDELQRNLAEVEQTVINHTGQKLIIRKYQSQCRRLAPLIPIAEPPPEYVIEASDLKPEVIQALRKIHHAELKRLILHQAVLRLFEAIGIEPYISIGRRLVVKLIGDEVSLFG